MTTSDRIPQNLDCIRCGTNLKNQLVDGRCPTCNAEIAQTLRMVPGAASALSPATTIERNTPCIHCGYNLRGLEPGHRCPECGAPIPESLAEDRLLFADPTWLRRVRTGLIVWRLTGIAILAGISVAVIAAALVGLPRRSAPPWSIILLAQMVFPTAVPIASLAFHM